MNILKKVKFHIVINFHYLLGLSLPVLYLASASNDVLSVVFISWMFMVVFYPASEFYTRVIREHERELGLH